MIFEEIAAVRKLELLSGIYFLILQGSVVYVGQSKTLMTRIAAHASLGKYEFDSYSYIEFPAEELNDREFEMIRKYKPVHNIGIPTGIRYLTEANCLRRLRNECKVFGREGRKLLVNPVGQLFCGTKVYDFEMVKEGILK